jgi:quercetin dioxygenase-like cupin family protein
VNEQISTIESGSLRFVVGGQEIVVKAGDSLVIPPNVPHLAEAHEDCIATDTFCPVREDWIRGDDAYLRG